MVVMRRVVLAVVALAGCLEPKLIECGDLLCAADQVCVPAANACFPADRVAACDGKADGESCQTPQLPNGLCRTGVCVPPGCGDAVIEIGEECDGGVGELTCLDRGFYASGDLACTADCRFDTTGCTGGYCGDQLRNGTELCDGAPPQAVSCLSIGYDYGAPSCSSICGFDAAPCGLISWQVEPTDVVAPIFDFAEINGVVSVLGARSILRRNGATWQAEALPTTVNMSGMWAASASDIYVVGQSGTILHFDGTAWTTMVSPTTEALRSIRGVSATDIYAVGANGTVLHYDGSTWQAMTSNTTAGLVKLAVVAANDIYAVGLVGTIIHWDGTSWTPMQSPLTASNVTLTDIRIIAADRIYVTGNSGTLLRYDGTQWIHTAVPRAGLLTGVLPVEHGLLVFGAGAVLGDSRLLVHYDGTDFINLEIPTSFAGGGPLWGGIVTSSGERLIAAGGIGGNVVMLRNTGPVWGKSKNTENFDVSDISIASNDNIYVVGMYRAGTQPVGQLYRFDGYIWSLMRDSLSNPTSVVAFAPNDIYVGESNGEVLHWNGSSWESTSSGLSSLVSLSAAPGTPLYGCGGGGVASFDGGSWTGEMLSAPCDDIHVFPDGNVIAFRADSIYIGPSLWDGTSWSYIPHADYPDLRFVWGASATDIYAAGDLGQLVHFDGTAWSPVDIGVAENITGISGTGSNDVWVTTAFGAIHHYDGVQWTPVRARFDPTALPIFTRLEAKAHTIAFGARLGRTDILLR